MKSIKKPVNSDNLDNSAINVKVCMCVHML